MGHKLDEAPCRSPIKTVPGKRRHGCLVGGGVHSAVFEDHQLSEIRKGERFSYLCT